MSCVPVAGAGPDVTGDSDLLVVGGPTHVYGMSSGPSRRLARFAAAGVPGEGEPQPPGPEADAGPGLRSWFRSLPAAPPGTRAAAFDTRADMLVSGGAAQGIARRLTRHRYDLVAELSTLRTLVASGLGVAVVPSTGDEATHEGRAVRVPLADPGAHRTIGVVVPAQGPRAAVVARFYAYVRSTARPRPGRSADHHL
ncbi:LysR substrate-binding domain-containing protein [Kitasatospora sp. MBT63]|uniref:LysR substrate-binding domain-containing protein n=1 Tax=Kitasatospora sp. MBT63 TaxID=1444768 RepID=UPI0011EA6B1A|nr:LysR substrate-binding domain-containing protein [Kitasatospora sp. MBT63]